MFESLKARLERFLADATPPADRGVEAAAIRDSLVEMRAAVLGHARRARGERARPGDRAPAGSRTPSGAARLAEEIGDGETTEVAEQFAERHRERAGGARAEDRGAARGAGPGRARDGRDWPDALRAAPGDRRERLGAAGLARARGRRRRAAGHRCRRRAPLGADSTRRGAGRRWTSSSPTSRRSSARNSNGARHHSGSPCAPAPGRARRPAAHRPARPFPEARPHLQHRGLGLRHRRPRRGGAVEVPQRGRHRAVGAGPGVGAVATQSLGNTAYGERGLELDGRGRHGRSRRSAS